MHIAWNEFTPILSLIGGSLIGLAAVILLLGNGRIAGIIGVIAGILKPSRGDYAWRLAFVIGLIAAPIAYQTVAPLPVSNIEASWLSLATAGVLVGIGTRLGSGCTSGHGVCGIARLSVRSVVATLLFMGSGFLTVFIIRHVLN
jgi:uncharacterized membrane protein YedE/YeeE